MYVDGLKINNKKRMNKKERKQNKDFCRRYYDEYGKEDYPHCPNCKKKKTMIDDFSGVK